MSGDCACPCYCWLDQLLNIRAHQAHQLKESFYEYISFNHCPSPLWCDLPII